MDTKPLQTEFENACSEDDFEKGRTLFKQYIGTLDFELTFQDVERELKDLAVDYNKPCGALILGYNGKQAIACAGVRKFDSESAELKRMFVIPEYRGQQLGKQLLEKALSEAKTLGYKYMLLDSVDTMKTAINLYKKYGFTDIDAYRYNPLEGAVYMRKEL
eukprot:TRINITY_DN6123_c0_g1_i2.p1 TRINITY_DN6123_c0_g1~~TRINITY_DN6123_c0_g1_i2.p1  ORF type:complete len:161 (-),score=17.42 TRINITY_DN6123_c0_g1_i2:52-534(-)